jgi:hypothetical protein
MLEISMDLEYDFFLSIKLVVEALVDIVMSSRVGANLVCFKDK